MRLTKWRDPNNPNRGVAQPGQAHYLDQIVAWLRRNALEFDLDNTLWRQSNHWDHCHADFNHHRRSGSRPPCVGGTIDTVNPSGSQFILTIGTSQPIPPGDEIVKTIDLQKALNAAGYGPLAEDGEHGPKTQGAWVEMMTDARNGESGGGISFGDAVVLAKP